MGRGNSGRRAASAGGSRVVPENRNERASNNAQNSQRGFVIDGVRYYASRRDAMDAARPGETEIAMVASGSGYAFYYLPMRPEDYQQWLRGGRSMREILGR